MKFTRRCWLVYRAAHFVALINPHKGKFNVTAKGGLVEEEYVDWDLRPYIYPVLLNLVGVAVGIWRFMYGPKMKSSPSG